MQGEGVGIKFSVGMLFYIGIYVNMDMLQEYIYVLCIDMCVIVLYYIQVRVQRIPSQAQEQF